MFLIFLCSGQIQARSATDSVRVYFRHGYSVLDLSLRDNRRVLDGLIGQLSTFSFDTTKCLIVLSIEGNTSPDGTHKANCRLSERRTERVLDYIRSRVAIPEQLVSTVAEGIDWDGLATLVESDASVPARSEVLGILQNTPLWVYDEKGRIVDGRKKQLMELRGGEVYRLLQERYFAELRNCTIELRYKTADIRPAAKDSAQSADMPERQIGAKTPPQELSCGDPAPAIGRADHPIAEQNPAQVPVQTEEPVSEPILSEPLHRLAIKTNLLYDAVLMPSLEVEYRIDNRWSINLEGEVAWWSNKTDHKYYQIATISPEGRYWFKARKPWHGHYVGAFVGGGWYDLENGDRGYRGELWMAGLSYGYMFPIGRCLSLETGIGVGFLHTKYKEYLPVDGHYVYQQTSRTNWLGPVKLKFALVWRLWDINRKGGAR